VTGHNLAALPAPESEHDRAGVNPVPQPLLEPHAQTILTSELRPLHGRLLPELLPLPFGDHLGGAVDHHEGRLLVDGVGRDADVLLVNGGDATYLCHWMRESGLADQLPSLPGKVWVGMSAGSMVMTPRIGARFVEWPAAPDDRTLGVVDFSIFPHLNAFPQNTLADAERWASEIGVAAYAIDEQSAIRVVEGAVEVVSEGQWTRFGS